MLELKINRKIEKIAVRDDDGTVIYEWSVPTDDASLQRMLNLVANAFERAKDLDEQISAATTPEDERKAVESTAKLQRRAISAIVGEQGYADILEYIGDGEPVDPCEHIVSVGDVFGALCMWLYERCSSRQLREAGAFFEKEAKSLSKGGKARKAKRK